MKKRTLSTIFAIAVLLFAASPASARSGALCGFRCNVEHFDFCIYTGERNYACWEMYGGCMSGGYNCDGGSF